jgi:heptosyltransferase-2
VWFTEFVGTWPILDDVMALLVSDLFIPVSISMVFVGYWVGARNSDERARTQWAVMGAATAMCIACLVIWILNHHLNVDPWPRPFETHEAAGRAVELLFYRPTDPSMPSNPAAVGFAAFTGIWLRNRKASIPLLIISSFWKHDLVIDTEPHFAISAIISFFIGRRSIGYDYGTRARLFDVPVHYNDKQHVVHTICDLLRPLGIKAAPKELIKLRYPDEAKSIVDLRFEKSSIRPESRTMIGVHAFCGPGFIWRAWPKERFAQLIDRIMERYDCIVVLTGSGDEAEGNAEIISMLKNRNRVFNFSNLPLSSLIYLVGHYGLMVSNDTGPMHIAAAQGVPTIGLFGPQTPVRFGPFPPERNIALYRPTECSPCINEVLSELKDCPYEGKCMNNITVDEVFEAVGKLLRKKPASDVTSFLPT